MRPIEPHQDALVEPAKPAQLQELWPRHLEHKGSDSDTNELGKNQHSARSDPIFMGEQPEPEHLERKQRRNWDDKHDERRGWRQLSDDAGKPRLDGPQWQPRDDPCDDRLKVAP